MFPIGDQIDPEIPTDPNELVLYKKYGKNWRDVISGKRYSRDRGGNLDRGMRFMHSTPEGFMQRPSMQSMQQVQQSNIDQSGFFAQMQKLQDEYNQALQEYYKYMSTPQYDQMQDYYAGNYQDYYGGGGGSQDNPYVGPPATDAAAAAATTAATTTTTAAAPVGVTGAGPVAGGGPPPPVLIPQVHRAAQFEPPEMKVAAPAAPASNDRGGDRIVAKAPTLNSFIQRYDRDESSPVVAPVKTVAPVKKVVKPASSFRKY